MQELKKLPFDPSGYGDFSYSYDGLDFTLWFEYTDEENRAKVCALKFTFCTFLTMNGTLSNYLDIPYDTVLVVEDNAGRDGNQRKYAVMLSGSDFQFHILATDFSIDSNSSRKFT